MANPQVRPIQDNIRLRETPGDGRAIGLVNSQDVLDTLESNRETRRKIGIPTEWLLVRTADGTSGYIAAQQLEAVYIPSDLPRKVRCISGGLRIRRTPGDGEAVGMLLLNELVETLESDDETDRKLGILGQWLHIKSRDDVIGYVAAWFMGSPAAAPAMPAPNKPTTPSAPTAPSLPAKTRTVYLKPKEDGLRIRELPRDGRVIGQASLKTTLESLEPKAETLAKIGVQNQWLHVRTQAGIEGYVAAWLVSEAEPPVRVVRPGANMLVGVNLDRFHPLGAPEAVRFHGAGWVRFPYNVSMGRGSQDLRAAYDLYRPLAEHYARAGIKVMFCFTQHTYGEGRQEFWPWEAMTDEKWRRFADRFTDMINRIAAQYAGQDLVHAWQVWNEQDAQPGTPATVPMPARTYGFVLGRSVQALRAADSGAAIITGGHCGGFGPGTTYARAAIAALPARLLPDGIAYHPYGRSQLSPARYTDFGEIRQELDAYLGVLPDRPVWINEWGALESDDEPTEDTANYAGELVDVVSREYGGRVAALLWNPWALGQHAAPDARQRDGSLPLHALYDRFLSVRG